MKILIDGIIFSLQKFGGTSVYFEELIKYSRKIDVAGELLIDGPFSNHFDFDHTNFAIFSRNARLLERYRSCRVSHLDCIFHSSYYRIPDNIKLPTVVTVHDFVYERYKSGIPRIVHSAQKTAAIRRAQAIICVSQATKDDLLEYFGEMPGKSVYVIHNGVSDRFFPINKNPNVVPYILFIGQRSGYKNFRLILSAMQYLPNINLYCVGGGDFKSNEFSGVSSSVVKRIKHCGFVGVDKLNVLYNNAICLVYPSLYEGFGIPVIEAMKAGCPVVSVNCKAVLEVGGEALSVVDNDPRSLAAEIDNISNSENLNKIQLGFSISEQFSWYKTHKCTFDVYNNLVDNFLVK